jgi:hypothetical protein
MVVAMQDRALTMSEKAQLRLHMAICKACPGFANQFLTMRSAMQQWRNYASDESAAAELGPASSEPASSQPASSGPANSAK